MKIFVQLYIIFLMINPMVIMCSKATGGKTGKLTLTQKAEKLMNSAKLLLKNGTTTGMKDGQPGKKGSSTIELQGKDQQTGNPTSLKTDAQEDLTLSDKAPVKNESTSIQLTSSVASKPKSVSTIAVGGKEKNWESQSFDKKEHSKVPDVTPLDTANVKDPLALALIQDNPTSQQSNKEVNKSLPAKQPATQSFVSEIAWSKLLPTKTISKTTSSAIDKTSNFFKDVSLTFKEKIAGKELSPEEQSFAARNQREQIQKIGKQINKITSNILEKETQLKQSRQELQIEKAQPASQPVWIAKHKKDIAQIKQTIEKQEQQKKSLQEQQTNLMADKFNNRGEFIVKSASAQGQTGIVSPIHSQVAVA